MNAAIERALTSVLMEISQDVQSIAKTNGHPIEEVFLFRHMSHEDPEYYGVFVHTTVENGVPKLVKPKYEPGDRFVIIDINKFAPGKKVDIAYCLVKDEDFIEETTCTYGMLILSTAAIHVFEYVTAGVVPPFYLNETKN